MQTIIASWTIIRRFPLSRGGLATIRTLLPYLWPPGQPGLKARVLSLLFSELRDAIFARVAQHAIRAVGLQIFRHLHGLGLRFHLERQTGGLTRAIEHGTKGIQTLLTFLLFNVLPTFFEIGLVCVVLWKMFDGWLALATGLTVKLYLAYTLIVTEWRAKFRRQMNETDSQANIKAMESLLNYETVKYFGNEEHEARRYDSSLRSYERAAMRNQVSLSILNIGQALIISAGLTVVMWMAAQGRYTLGDFVLLNTYLLQLYAPLSFFGFIYREIKQALIDMERMFELLGQDREVADKADAPALRLQGGAIEFRDVVFGYDDRRPILNGRQLQGAGRQDRGRGGQLRRGQVHPGPPAVPLL